LSSGWLIDGEHLSEPARRGGREGRRGNTYQDSFAVLQLATLADPDSDLVAVRSEGSQDIDLSFADGRQRYVQLKDNPRKRYTIAVLAPIIAGFVRDWLDAGRSEDLSFELVASSGNLDDAATAIEKDGLAASQSFELVDRILAEPRCAGGVGWVDADADARRVVVEAVVERTTLAFRHGPTVDGRPSFDDAARLRLMRLGVDREFADEAYAALRVGTEDGKTMTAEDILEILTPFVLRSGMELFDGAMRAVDKELLERRATEDRVRAFYRGARVTWEIIASKVDVRRDQAPEIAALARERSEQLGMVVIAGGPGSGKSTLLRRIGATLAQTGHTVLYFGATADPSTLQRLEGFCAVVAGQVVVLVDDVFRREGMVEALSDLEPSLPVTFICTSNANEYVPETIAGTQRGVELNPVSDGERERLLAHLDVDIDRVKPAERRKLLTAPSIAVLVREAYGEGGEKSQRTAIDWLARNDRGGYEIYARVSFCSRVGISVPVAILARRWGPVDRPSLRELVGFTESSPDLVNAGHPTTATIAWDVFGETRDPLNELRTLIAEADVDSAREREFRLVLIGSLFRANGSPQAEDALAVAKSVFEEDKPAMTAAELMKWARFWNAAGESELAEIATEATSGRKPTSGADLQAIVSVLRREGRNRLALELLEFHLAENDWVGGRGSYVRLAREYGTPAQRSRALGRTSQWLELHPNNPVVRTALLRLATEEEGPTALQEQVELAITWLEMRPNDRHVRAAVLNAATGGATDDQVRWLLDDTRRWLKEGPEARDVWRRQARLVFARGSDEDRAWLEGEAAREQVDPAVLRALAWSKPEKSTVARLLDSVERLEREHERLPTDPDLLDSVTAAARRLQKLGDLDTRISELYEGMAASPGDEVLTWRAVAYAKAVVDEGARSLLAQAAMEHAASQSLAAAVEVAPKVREIGMMMPRRSSNRKWLLERVDEAIFELAMAGEASAGERLDAASFLLGGRRGDLAEWILMPCVEDDPEDRAARELLARSLLRRDGSARRSLEHWTWLVQRPPHAARHHSGRAKALAMLADEAESEGEARKLRRKADRDFARALERWKLDDGNREQVLRHRAWVLVNLKDPRAALTAIGQMQGPIRFTVSVRLARAAAYIQIGNGKRAEQVLKFLRTRGGQNSSEGAERKIDELLEQAKDLGS
jgi:hypothetical protein